MPACAERTGKAIRYCVEALNLRLKLADRRCWAGRGTGRPSTIRVAPLVEDAYYQLEAYYRLKVTVPAWIIDWHRCAVVTA